MGEKTHNILFFSSIPDFPVSCQKKDQRRRMLNRKQNIGKSRLHRLHKSIKVLSCMRKRDIGYKILLVGSRR